MLREVPPYLKRTLNLVDVEVLPIEGALAQVEAGKAGYSRMIAESPGLELKGQVNIVCKPWDRRHGPSRELKPP